MLDTDVVIVMHIDEFFKLDVEFAAVPRLYAEEVIFWNPPNRLMWIRKSPKHG